MINYNITELTDYAKVHAHILSAEGIVAFDRIYGKPGVHLTQDVFHKLFDEYKVKPCGERLQYEYNDVDGVFVFCLREVNTITDALKRLNDE